MFKNLSFFRLAGRLPRGAADLAARLDAARFVECPPGAPSSSGFVAPRGGDADPLVEAVAGRWLFALAVETKLLPASVVRRRADDMAAAAEKSTGFPVGKKRRRELRDEAMLELLPRAFTRRATTLAFIVPNARLLAVDTTVAGRLDALLGELVRAVDGLAAQPVSTAVEPAAAMAAWLADGEPPGGLTIDRDCELASPDADKAVVRWTRHPLEPAELAAHLAAGKRVRRLALTHAGRLSAIVTDALQLRRVAFADGVLDASAADPGERFDADAAIATAEVVAAFDALVEGFGGPADAAPGALPATAAPQPPPPASTSHAPASVA